MLTSSLCHLTTANEEFEPAILNHFAFAVEKLDEIRDLDAIRNGQGAEALAANKELFATERVGENAELRARIAGLTDADYTRLPAFAEREAIQEEASNFQLFQQLPSVHSLKLRKYVLNVWPSVRVNCHKKNTMPSLLKPSTNGSNGKKKLDLTCLYTVNSSVTTWLSTSVKTCQVTSSLRTVGYIIRYAWS